MNDSKNHLKNHAQDEKKQEAVEIQNAENPDNSDKLIIVNNEVEQPQRKEEVSSLKKDPSDDQEDQAEPLADSSDFTHQNSLLTEEVQQLSKLLATKTKTIDDLNLKVKASEQQNKELID